MLRQRDDLDAANRLLTDEPREERVRRRATGAPFGGEQLDENRYTRFVGAGKQR